MNHLGPGVPGHAMLLAVALVAGCPRRHGRRIVDELLATPSIAAIVEEATIGRGADRRPPPHVVAADGRRPSTTTGSSPASTNVHVVDASVFPDVPRSGTVPADARAGRAPRRPPRRAHPVTSGPWGPTERVHDAGDGMLGVRPARRVVGVEQRRAGRRRRRVAARRHALRPARARRRCSTPSAPAPPARRSASSSTPTPTATTATATSSSAGAEIIASTATAEEMAEVSPAMLGGLCAGPGRGRRPVPQLLRRLPVRRHHADAADADVRGSPQRRRRRARGRADRGRTGAHEGRHDRPRARRQDRLHGRHPVHQRHADRVGRPAGELGRGVRPDARHGRRRRRPGPRAAHRQGRRRRGARLPGVRRRRGDGAPRRRRRRVRGGQGDQRPHRRRSRLRRAGARPGASPSTSRPCTARSTRRTAAPTSSSSSGGWPRSTTGDLPRRRRRR